MGLNATIHAKDDGVLNPLGDPTWQPLKSTDGALHVTGGSAVTLPGGGTGSLPQTLTLTDGTEQEMVLQGVALPRTIAILPVSGDTVRVRFRYESGGDWLQPSETLAITNSTSDDGKVHSLDLPVYSMGVTRTGGSGTTSKVVIS
mgnify:CR=1 FL=1